MMGASATGATAQAPGSSTSTAAGNVAQRWAWTYSDVNFVTDSVVVTDSAITGNANNASSIAAYNKLLDHSQALLQLALVQYTPTGGASEQTDTVITIGREIQFTTDDVRIRVKFMVADRSAFILDNSQLGVLDQNRLG